MAIVHDSFALAAATPTIIATIPAGNPTTVVTVTNVNAGSVFIGDSSVATGNTVDRGLRIATNATQQVSLNAGDVLYAISLAGTSSSYDVTVLYSKVVA
jgi:ATP-dependent protease HslVU (ClpYQ) peptidase subunit